MSYAGAAQAHADQLHVHSQHTQSHPVMVQAVVQAQSFQAKAQSLEKAAEAQNLQACPLCCTIVLVCVLVKAWPAGNAKLSGSVTLSLCQTDCSSRMTACMVSRKWN